MAEALGAAGSIVGIVSFALKLSNTLQLYVATIADRTRVINGIVDDINSTASALQQLHAILEQDGVRSGNNTRHRLVTEEGEQEVKRLASKCQLVYENIVKLVVKASGTKDAVESPNGTPASLDNLQAATFSQKMRWPWLYVRIQRFQTELNWLKVSLMFQLMIFQMGKEAHKYVFAPSISRKVC